MERWPGKIGLADKWRTCSYGRVKRPQQESRNEKTSKIEEIVRKAIGGCSRIYEIAFMESLNGN